MGNTDEQIEKIVNRQYQEPENTDESISFIPEDYPSIKPIEHIAFQNVNGEMLDEGHRGNLRYGEMSSNDTMQSKIMGYRPFKTPNGSSKEVLLENKEIKLEDLLGLGDSGNIKSHREQNDMSGSILNTDEKQRTLLFNTGRETNNPRTEEINQFIDDLFSNPGLEKKVTERQRYRFEEAVFAGMHTNEYNEGYNTASLGYEMPRNTQNYTYSQESPSKYTSGSPVGNQSNFSFNDKQDGKKRAQTSPSQTNTSQRWELNNGYSRETNTPDCLLFRNPVMQQKGFTSQGYCKMKKRRRMSSSAWYSAGGMLAVHPSKLSSFEFVHGGMSLMPMVGQGGIPAFSTKPGPETGRVIESFRKEIDRLDFDNITVHELKNIMKDYGLNASGKKKEMIDRLKNTMKELGRRENGEDEGEIVNNKHTDPQYDKYFF